MRAKLLFLLAFLIIFTATEAQNEVKTLEKAIEILSKRKPDLVKGDFNVFALPRPLNSSTTIKYIRTITSPDTASWFFFIDLRPYAGWAHPCAYLFINTLTGSFKIINSDFPPDLSAMQPIVTKKMPAEGKLFTFERPKPKATSLATSHDYAVIISGGMDKMSNWKRYWNNCSAIYSSLVNFYGFDRSHIKVLISDGTNLGFDRRSVTFDEEGNPIYSWDSSPLDLDGDGTNDINYSATKANIRIVFNNLSSTLTSEDHLFIFTTDHGGPDVYGHVIMCLWGENIRDDEFAVEVNKIHTGIINIFMEQCCSGGFINDLSGSNRLITTACADNESSFPRTDLTYDEFVYHWVSAITSKTPEGTTVNADSNNDVWVSMQEAFNYAVNHDTKTENPQYNSTPIGLGCITKMINNCYYPLTNPTLICSLGASYAINNIFPGCSVSWGKSDNLNLTPIPNSNQAIISANGNGAGWVQATINSPTCGNIQLSKKSVWLGSPSTPDNIIGFYNGQVFGSESEYDFHAAYNANQGVNAFDWVVAGGTILEGQGTNMVTVKTCQNTGSTKVHFDVKVRVGNDCGWCAYLWRTGYVTSGVGPAMLVISPNPASESVNITIATEQATDLSSLAIPQTRAVSQAEGTRYSVKVYNTFGAIFYSATKAGETFTIPVNNLKDGTYIVEVSNEAHRYTQQLIIKR